MKKITGLIVLGLISVSIFLLGFDYRTTKEPNNYYQVYLDDKIIGVINSKEELEKFIDNRGEFIKKTYEVDTVYSPEGLEIRKINTFVNKVDTVESVYKKIEQEKPFTIRGYQLTIKSEIDSKKIFVTKEEVFQSAVSDMIKTFVGTKRYSDFLNNTQNAIVTTGKRLESVFIQEDITIKEVKIPVTETIYNDSKELAKFLLFGTIEEQKEYTVQSSDTIEMVSFNNKISIEEFLISNPTFTNEKNLLFPGQKVVIGITDPQIRVVQREYVVEDLVSNYKTEFVVDPNLYLGEKQVVRKGTNGIVRVAQNIVTVNGSINEVTGPESKVEILMPINEVIRIGDKRLPVNVGGEGWIWPTNSGWRITSPYSYRINPINGAREFHDAIDIAGTGYRSNIYAANNGTVVTARRHPVNGNYVIINHNNGYYSLYAHLDSITVSVGQTVVAGQVIGYMGSTGWATGVHLHFAIYDTMPLTGRSALNPSQFYPSQFFR
jgi:murein DD-endopeptidase MepM/ murein hydrolase activator NlpD